VPIVGEVISKCSALIWACLGDFRRCFDYLEAPTTTPFFYKQLCRPRPPVSISFFRSEYIFDLERTVVVETPPTSAMPHNLFFQACKYVRVPGDLKITRGRHSSEPQANVAARPRLLGAVLIQGLKLGAWLKDLKRRASVRSLTTWSLPKEGFRLCSWTLRRRPFRSLRLSYRLPPRPDRFPFPARVCHHNQARAGTPTTNLRHSLRALPSRSSNRRGLEATLDKPLAFPLVTKPFGRFPPTCPRQRRRTHFDPLDISVLLVTEGLV